MNWVFFKGFFFLFLGGELQKNSLCSAFRHTCADGVTFTPTFPNAKSPLVKQQSTWRHLSPKDLEIFGKKKELDLAEVSGVNLQSLQKLDVL